MRIGKAARGMIIIMNSTQESHSTLTHILFHSCKALSLYNGLVENKFGRLWITNEKVTKISTHEQCYRVLKFIFTAVRRISVVLLNCIQLKPNVKENGKF